MTALANLSINFYFSKVFKKKNYKLYKKNSKKGERKIQII